MEEVCVATTDTGTTEEVRLVALNTPFTLRMLTAIRCFADSVILEKLLPITDESVNFLRIRIQIQTQTEITRDTPVRKPTVSYGETVQYVY